MKPLLAILLFTMAATVSRAAEDDRLSEFFKAFLEDEFRERPLAATQLGNRRGV